MTRGPLRCLVDVQTPQLLCVVGKLWARGQFGPSAAQSLSRSPVRRSTMPWDSQGGLGRPGVLTPPVVKSSGASRPGAACAVDPSQASARHGQPAGRSAPLSSSARAGRAHLVHRPRRYNLAPYQGGRRAGAGGLPHHSAMRRRRTAAGLTQYPRPRLQISSGPRPRCSITLLQERSWSPGVRSTTRPQPQPGPACSTHSDGSQGGARLC
ncbi:hypothetical protein NDU88_006821 [Pleurodeles waltl]|uniref:Uncharacterized protein n=1 Tax=Pleurodeles waltl TaxID=8319 RepID=A0AAV7PJH1_PLEWA|nr:hypothetical protein NDU88_006821 [Pleurodeles waltl]